MSRRGSNIFKRKDGRWEGRYKSGIKENGWAKYSSVYAPSYAECAEKLKAVKMWEPSVKRTPTVRELFDMWLSNRKNSIKQSTYSSYSALYENYIHKEIGGYKADDVTSELLTCPELGLPPYVCADCDKQEICTLQHAWVVVCRIRFS